MKSHTPPSNTPILSLDRVTIGYGGRAVFTDISLALARGSFTALLGANGCGKTTLLKTIIGVLPPIAGTVHLHEMNGDRPVVGYVPQRETLDPMFLLSCFEVALMGCYGRVSPGRRLPASERDFVRECLRRVRAGELEAKPFAHLSSGQKQRVLIARALVTRPDLLVLDEPTVGIDVATTEAILELLRQLHREEGLTTLMVSHNLREVREVAEQVLWLHGGAILQGTVSELLTPQRMEEILELQLS